MHKSWLILALLIVSPLVSRATEETYKIDPTHSTVGFKVKHLFSNATGRFKEFEGTMSGDPADPEKSQVNVTIKTASIDTGNAKRDANLRNEDFFDAEKYPEITFKSTSVKKIESQTGDDEAGQVTGDVTGDLTMHGVTQPVVLRVKFLGKGPGMGGGIKSGWEASTEISRAAFGLTWNNVIEGTAVVGDKVEVDLQIEADLVK